jgi:hypothetical protein
VSFSSARTWSTNLIDAISSAWSQTINYCPYSSPTNIPRSRETSLRAHSNAGLRRRSHRTPSHTRNGTTQQPASYRPHQQSHPSLPASESTPREARHQAPSSSHGPPYRRSAPTRRYTHHQPLHHTLSHPCPPTWHSTTRRDPSTEPSTHRDGTIPSGPHAATTTSVSPAPHLHYRPRTSARCTERKAPTRFLASTAEA